MTGALDDFAFTIMYKLPRKKELRMDYVASSLRDVMRMLSRSEGVDTTNVESLYIHQHLPGGLTQEVVAIENRGNIPTRIEQKSNVVDINTAKKSVEVKPHIKLKAAVLQPNSQKYPPIFGGYGRYVAMPAL